MARNKDNVLGAPTEGLGQTVTFAFNEGSAVPQGDMQRPTQVEASRGPRAAQMSSVAHMRGPKNDELMDMLMQFGGAIAARAGAEDRKAGILRGMQRAAAGEGIQEIADEQPWYSRIFGESSAVEGARQYESTARTNEVLTSLETDMPELRKLGQEAMRNEVDSRIQRAMSGDAGADTAIMQSLIESMPSVFKRQAKEHYGYQQEVASANEMAAFRTGGSLLDAQAKNIMANGEPSPSDVRDMGNARFRLLSQIVPVQGRDQEGWQKDTTENLVSMAKQGQLHALGVLTATDAGDGIDLLSNLQPDQNDKVMAAIGTAEQKARDRYATGNNEELAQLIAMRSNPLRGGKEGEYGPSAAEYGDMLDAYSRKFMLATGSSVPFFNAKERADMVAGNAIAIKKNEEARIEQHLRNQERLENRRFRQESLRMQRTQSSKPSDGALFSVIGKGKEVVEMGFASEADLTRVTANGYQAMVHNGAPREQVNALVDERWRGSQKTIAGEAAYRQNVPKRLVSDPKWLASEEGRMAAEAAVAEYRHMAARPDGARMVDAYYGDFAPVMAAMANTPADVQSAGIAAVQDHLTRPQKQLSDADTKILKETAKVKTHKSWYEFGAGDSLNESGQRMISSLARSGAERYLQQGHTSEIAMELAVADVRSGNHRGPFVVEEAGALAWTMPRGTPSVLQALRTAADGVQGLPIRTEQEALELALNAELYDQTNGRIPRGLIFGNSATSTDLRGIELPGGGAGLIVTYTYNGRLGTFTMDTKDIKKRVHEGHARLKESINKELSERNSLDNYTSLR